MKIIKEHISFQRGIDPKDSMNIGGYRDLDQKFDDLVNPRSGSEREEENLQWSVYGATEAYVNDIDFKLARELKYRIVLGENPNKVCLDILGKLTSDDKQYRIDKIKKIIHLSTKRNGSDKWDLKESLNFQRGQDPKQAMDIGLFAKINKITSSDLELLKVYTGEGQGKGTIDEEFFHDVYESSASYEEYLKRVKEVYKLLEPYEYLFGDNFGEDMKKEMKEYVNSYLKNPKYNYAYNCDIMEEGDFDVFFCEIELPSAELLGKKKIKESMDFERGVEPKQTLGIGVKEKIRQGLIGLLHSSRDLNPINHTQISTINLLENRDQSWLEISDYGTKNFEDVFDSFLSPEYFKELYIKAKPKKYSKSWRNEWKAIIKDEYREFFKDCFDPEGFIKESVNFERGQNPMDSMEIGRVEDRRQELIDWITEEDPNKWIGSSVLAPFTTRRFPNPLGWDMSKFEDISFQELRKIKEYIEKWNEVDKKVFKGSLFNGPASTVQETLNFERGRDPKYSMNIGKFQSAYLEGRGKCSVLEVKKYKDFTPEELDSLGTWYGSSLSRWQGEKTQPETIWVKIRRETEDRETEWMDLERFEELKKKGRWLDPNWEKRNGKWYRIKEAFDFERGRDPYKAMKIGYIRPVNKLKKDYDLIQELVQTGKYHDFQVAFSQEALELIENNNNFGWGNIQYNFKNMTREELYPFEELVQKYTKLLGLDEPQR